MEYIITGIVFFIIFSSIILIHEGGHFWAARIAKIHIEEFGFGLPPRLWGRKSKKSGVLYSINWIPFGGFVRMLGEDDPGNKKAKKDPHAFNNRPLIGRIFAVCAGVLMNFLLGWFLLFLGFSLGMKPIIFDQQGMIEAYENNLTVHDDSGVWIQSVVEGSPADNAGIMPGDFITSVDQTEVSTRDEFLEAIDGEPRGNGFHFGVLRKEYDQENPQGFNPEFTTYIINKDEEGHFGVYPYPIPFVYDFKKEQFPVHIAAVEAAKEVGTLSVATVKMLGGVVKNLVSTLSVPEGVGGPVAIAQMTHFFVLDGDIIEILKFAALLSISIAVINIMPFPALDGGRLVFLLFEGITGRHPSDKAESYVHAAGFMLLIVLLIAVTWNDIARIFAG
jgi:regulator of sigma E protease